MKRGIYIIISLFFSFMICFFIYRKYSFMHYEVLNRNMILVNKGEGVLISFRLLKTDSNSTHFELYRNGSLISSLNNLTTYYDKTGKLSDKYELYVYSGKRIVSVDKPKYFFSDLNSTGSGAYYDIFLDNPDSTIYSPGDINVGDVDGDGEYEIILKWDTTDLKDNSENGYTSNVYVDCYKLNGKKLWRIDLGKNIRAGAHYTQINVYDYDLDGKAEVILKTADGSIDGAGSIIGNKDVDYRDSFGRILFGNEYLSLFDGETGEMLDTINYEPERGRVSDWGDSYGNRVDRFLTATAFLDGKTPSAVFIRGCYTRVVAVSYNVVNKRLVRGFVYDTDQNENKIGYGDVNHQVMIGDVDLDGKDEIILGSSVIDNNGKLLYTTSLGHGDAMQVGDFVKDNKGLEVFMCHEDEKSGFGISLRDGKSGKLLFRDLGSFDTGRCLIGKFVENIDKSFMTGTHNYKIFDEDGKYYKDWDKDYLSEINGLIYWRDGFYRDLLDGNKISSSFGDTLFVGDFVKSINGTKNNASLVADLFGDFREEIILPTNDNLRLRVFTTTYETDKKIVTLMQNHQYRMQIASQNSGYNQSANLDYYLND